MRRITLFNLCSLFISFATDEYLTPPITVEKEVLQGDSLSLLFFHLVINTLTNTIKQEKKLYRIYLRWLYTTETLATICR